MFQKKQLSPNSALDSTAHKLQQVIDGVDSVVLGKSSCTRLILCALLSRGHVLIEDRPGVGKSTLAKAFAKAIGLEHKRVQMTADLLPSDLTGGVILDPVSRSFVFRKGPLFAPLVFLDELNRASARTQSALLEAMEERQITADGTTHPLPFPFFVLATQNPDEGGGTYGLPESQRDRFLLKVSLGLPERENERILLTDPDHIGSTLKNLEAVLQPGELEHMMRQAAGLHVSPAVVEYALDLVGHTRKIFAKGLSPRASVGLLGAAKAAAFIAERPFVIPEDIQFIFPHLVAHRLQASDRHDQQETVPEESLGQWILRQVPVRQAPQ